MVYTRIPIREMNSCEIGSLCEESGHRLLSTRYDYLTRAGVQTYVSIRCDGTKYTKQKALKRLKNHIKESGVNFKDIIPLELPKRQKTRLFYMRMSK